MPIYILSTVNYITIQCQIWGQQLKALMIVSLKQLRKKLFLGSQSDVHRFYIIRPKSHGTCWTLAVTSFNNLLYTGIAEQVIAFCNDNLERQISKLYKKKNYNRSKYNMAEKDWSMRSSIDQKVRNHDHYQSIDCTCFVLSRQILHLSISRYSPSSC